MTRDGRTAALRENTSRPDVSKRVGEMVGHGASFAPSPARSARRSPCRPSTTRRTRSNRTAVGAPARARRDVSRSTTTRPRAPPRRALRAAPERRRRRDRHASRARATAASARTAMLAQLEASSDDGSSRRFARRRRGRSDGHRERMHSLYVSGALGFDRRRATAAREDARHSFKRLFARRRRRARRARPRRAAAAAAFLVHERLYQAAQGAARACASAPSARRAEAEADRTPTITRRARRLRGSSLPPAGGCTRMERRARARAARAPQREAARRLFRPTTNRTPDKTGGASGGGAAAGVRAAPAARAARGGAGGAAGRRRPTTTSPVLRIRPTSASGSSPRRSTRPRAARSARELAARGGAELLAAARGAASARARTSPTSLPPARAAAAPADDAFAEVDWPRGRGRAPVRERALAARAARRTPPADAAADEARARASRARRRRPSRSPRRATAARMRAKEDARLARACDAAARREAALCPFRPVLATRAGAGGDAGRPRFSQARADELFEPARSGSARASPCRRTPPRRCARARKQGELAERAKARLEAARAPVLMFRVWGRPRPRRRSSRRTWSSTSTADFFNVTGVGCRRPPVAVHAPAAKS